ncbi:helix-turn-helix domain-containing protein [Streptomyces mexicanus]|uniref:helix-turn-helix domain-containing protein n=1 Tax=Streptomyces mexicanus TaxID=178566 RepID=UPI00364BCCFD
MAGEDFAELLRELKERSGLSYGALGKRLHMSASTVHRYVSGDVVPTDYAPVERLARICRATPEELLELHRRWVRADALRGVKAQAAGEAPARAEAREAGRGAADEARTEAGGGAGAGSGIEEAGTEEAGRSAAGSRGGSASGSREEPAAGASQGPPAGAWAGSPAGPTAPHRPRPETENKTEPETEAETETEAEPAVGPRPAPRDRKKRPAALLVSAGIVAVAAATALVVNLVPGGSGGADRVRGVGEAVSAPASTAHTGGTAGASGSASPSPSASRSGQGSATPSATASGGRSRAGTGALGAGKASSGTGTGDAGGADAAGPVPVTVATTPYYWHVPCEQSFLVDRSPQNVPPPPPQQDAVGWAAPLGAVAADHQTVVLTVQGTGARTVVLQALHVRVVSSGAPLTWNKYAMGDGCGGGVDTKSFDVSLDLGNPLAQPIAGQRPFPYKVSESDPEVFYVNAHTSGHDVRWYLELDWSSGERHGTVRVDDHGRPFRTSGSGKPYYVQPLGRHEWERVEDY